MYVRVHHRSHRSRPAPGRLQDMLHALTQALRRSPGGVDEELLQDLERSLANWRQRHALPGAATPQARPADGEAQTRSAGENMTP